MPKSKEGHHQHEQGDHQCLICIICAFIGIHATASTSCQ
jgi:hypothetical protein